jgi:hypothetical protein
MIRAYALFINLGLILKEIVARAQECGRNQDVEILNQPRVRGIWRNRGTSTLKRR